jgi:hypothetical protein
MPKVLRFSSKVLRMKKVAVGTAMSDVGKTLIAGNRFSLAFDEIENLSSLIISATPFKGDKHALAYRHLILKAKIQRKKNPEDTNIVNGFIGPFSKMKDAFITRILDEDLTFLQENEITIVKAKTEASLPLSKAYEWALQHDEELLNNIECTLLMLFRHLENPDTPTGKKLTQICSEFKKTEKEIAGNNAVSNIVKKVKQNVGKNGTDSPQTADVMRIVQAIVGNGEDGDIGSLAQGILSGQVTIPQLVEQVKTAVEGGGQEQESEDEDQQGQSRAEDVD